MRISVRVAIILVIFSGHALAKGKKGADEGKSGAGMMDSNDPADKETSDKGPYAPPKKSEQTEAKEKKEKEAEVVEQQHEDIKRRPRDKFGVFGNVVIGFGRPPEPGTSTGSDGDPNGTNKGTSFTFMVGGHYDVSPQFTLGLRVPWTTARQRQIDGSYAGSQALGAPELMGEYRVVLSPRTNLPFDFGIGVPVAQGSYDNTFGAPQYRQTIVNDTADAASGFRDGELFSPKRLPLILGIGIDYERKELSLHAATKFVAGFKVGGSLNYGTLDQGVGTYELKSVTFRNVTSAGIGYQFLGKPALSVELDSWIVTNAVNAVEFKSNAGATGPNRIQVVAEPRLKARFGKTSPSLGYIFPLGGRLADDHTSGLELHCDIAF
jgi:hypothetical protein